MKKRTAAIFLALTLVLGLGVGAFAASNNETISALLNRELKVVYNGVEQNFTDAYGNAVYPISYNSTTYLPVRAISGMVGLPIDFDGEAYAVVIGNKDVQPAALVDLHNSGNTEYSKVIIEDAELTVETTEGSKTYSNGIYWNIWNSFASAGDIWAVMFDVNGYSTITFTAWSDVDCTVVVYDQDGGLMTQFDVAAKTPVVKTLPLAATQTKIGFAANGKTMADSGEMKILDASVK